MDTSNSYLRLRGLPLQQRLPLLICILLLSLMVLFSWISYQGVKNAALRTARERLLSLSNQFGSLFSQSMVNLSNATRMVANQAPVKKFLENPAGTSRDSVLSILQGVRRDSSTVLVYLVDKNHRLLMHSPGEFMDHRHKFDTLLSIGDGRDTGVGMIRSFGDSLYYPVTVAIMDNRRVAGYLVRWRLLSTTPQAVEQISRLIGTRAALFVGNHDGSLWTDMVKPVKYYKLDSGQLNRAIEHNHATGSNTVSASTRVPNTPWLVAVEFSQRNILEPANRFLRWMIIGGLILLGIGILLAWIMSRNIIRPLNRLTEAASGIATGNYMPAEGIERRDEVGKLARAFNTMISQVREARQGLEQKIIETDEMNVQLRSLTAHLQNIREEERIHIAREMHDELGQLLTAFKMDLSWLQKKIGDAPDSAVAEKLRDMNGLVENAVVFVRRIASELRPSVLDDFGLVPALEWHSEEFQKRFRIKVEFKSDIRELKTSSFIATALFRIYQESLTNVARHAQAERVDAQLSITPDQLILTITDNGKGFNLHKGDQRKTLGLLGMKERAAMVGGQLMVRSSPGKGTSIVISVPVPNVSGVADQVNT